MWYQFFLQNAHFGLNLFGALVTISVAWLFLDAYLTSKSKKDGLRSLGFGSVAFSFVIHAVFVESGVLGVSLLPETLHNTLFLLARIVGYGLTSLSLFVDPIQPRPKVAPQTPNAAAFFGLPWFGLQVVLPVLSGVVLVQYVRRATTGLERHLRPVAVGFAFITASEVLGLFSWLRDATDNVLFEFVAAFGPIWISEHLLLAVGLIILGRWIFTYLLERLVSQLFIIMSTSILVIFFIISVVFTGLLVGNIEQETLKQLETDAKVLEFAFTSKRQETLADAQVLAQNQLVQVATFEKAKAELADILEQFLLAKKQSMLVVVDTEGRVLARGEDRERTGEVLMSDLLIKRALVGQEATSVVTTDGVVASEVSVRSAVPIKFEESIVGAVMTGVPLDNAFVDSVKTATGLDASVYADNTLSATTLTSPGGKARPLGIQEENSQVKSQVLIAGESFRGRLTFLSRPYFLAFTPLIDVDNQPVGMLSIGKPQSSVLETAARSIEITFLVTAGLLMFSIVPIYLISRNIAKQFA